MRWPDTGTLPHAAASGDAPWEVEQRTHYYTCHGATPLFAALDVSADKVMGRRFMGTVLFCLRNDDWLLRSWAFACRDNADMLKESKNVESFRRLT
jgi:hypothetical protein